MHRTKAHLLRFAYSLFCASSPLKSAGATSELFLFNQMDNTKRFKLKRAVLDGKVDCACCEGYVAKPFKNPFGKGYVHKNCVKNLGTTIARERLSVFAEEMRNNPTPSEKLILHRLEVWGRENQIEVIFQQVFWGRIFDFYLKGKGILIEIDGRYHIEGAQRRIDSYKQQQAIRRGFIVIRIQNEEVAGFDLSLLLVENPNRVEAENALAKWLSQIPRLKNKKLNNSVLRRGSNIQFPRLIKATAPPEALRHN